ncbi:putative chemotaxis protein-glutamate methylesterase [Desulfosarcina cetonica]|nr:putative chemotaxis protein-glutamate methylesterase [Desulfosarcina cetonica]
MGSHDRVMHNSPTDMAETIDRLRPTVCRAVVIGGSAGGIDELIVILSKLPENFQPPVLVAQHLHPSDNGAFSRHLETKTQLPVIEPSDKTVITPNRIYTAPANYHMLVEEGGSIALSIDPRVRWSRPSIDVLFKSAARAWAGGLTAIILSGTNDDGAQGVCTVRKAGGHTIAQAPSSAGSPFMPRAAIDTGMVDVVLPTEAIARHLIESGIK